ncbi:MAG: (2Fe-2S)-binding protein [Desulfobacterota bacterium]|nr:(2Fe-2S)-binding protein [Thermodesulfobacteriota bacterium]
MTGKGTAGFTCPYCGKRFDTFEELKQDILTSHRGSPLPAPEGQIRLIVNGQEHVENVEPSWTLYHLIHDRLGMTGSKQFCDRGACGSCTVIMDGLPVLSCMVLAIECDGRTIETVEGIARDNHPLIESYVEHHAMQCGYCTPGFVVTSKALLDRNPDPTEEEIRDALSGNLCRCGTYPQHIIAVREAAGRLPGHKDSGGV